MPFSLSPPKYKLRESNYFVSFSQSWVPSGRLRIDAQWMLLTSLSVVFKIPSVESWNFAEDLQREGERGKTEEGDSAGWVLNLPSIQRKHMPFFCLCNGFHTIYLFKNRCYSNYVTTSSPCYLLIWHMSYLPLAVCWFKTLTKIRFPRQRWNRLFIYLGHSKYLKSNIQLLFLNFIK